MDLHLQSLPKNLPDRQKVLELKEKFPDMDPLSVEAFFVFLRTSGDLIKKIGTNLSCWGITPGRMMTLMALFNHSRSMAPSELAERIGVTRGTITGLLDGLEKDGLIQRMECCSDRRMINIQLTDKGVEFINEMVPSHFELIGKIMKVLDETEIGTLIALLEKVHGRVHEL
ncbi:MarR family transcriptional regulator [Fodinisporobacter ferrooxydans]|uniref:MarR family transcriptional regulator n=1 Tax=Fodinisporobacter ferrooxydans TaxID=2901836 RepID=A0ABY4CMI9_9BACL|nr:MarR family transcriptional regulator [Alicyclobacillaceae bacterium MYW30-H2]